MRDENSKKSKLSRPMTLVKKWFNIKIKGQECHADDASNRGDTGKCREALNIKKDMSDRSMKDMDQVHRGRSDIHSPQVTDVQEYKIFAATWNVGGKSPPRNLNLLDWLHASSPADIYVLGFQEIVPLNAGNVLGTEDNGPANKWLWLIRKTLNSPDTCGSDSYHTPSPVPYPILELNADFDMSSTKQKNSSFHQRRSFHSLSHISRVDGDNMVPQLMMDRRNSAFDRTSFESRPSDFDSNFRCEGSSDDENTGEESATGILSSPVSYGYGVPPYIEERIKLSANSRYCLVASKQMVGIFLTIWVRSDIREDIKNLKISCVGRGLMGYLGNKGSISISMSMHETSFCFICSHLTSGQKDGDELRRNSDVMEILKKTRFPWAQTGDNEKSPETILDHDRIIWLGDLNYRIALSFRSVKTLVEMRNWRALLEKDQLRIEQRSGRVFVGWKEGTIFFPPTYKYSNNSDRYAGDDMNPKWKRRTPAWCDRILWHGSGLSQLSYVRGESRFSDHRPVYSIFTAEVEMINHSQFRKNMGYSSSRVEVEELLPHSHDYAYKDY
ncbi:type I inositol polyphosphate 5-phosphatase 4-like [Canna indica]|uniref:Type I inositol polyphosphate 5-phosphatase 4-like n=1 Tax=Canna indica TaxID=4628 RepID=A0AAQ3JVV6_9LILI|nr:type I inositol polyphosphate 5-phosphatase 4-like [Canna indica]